MAALFVLRSRIAYDFCLEDVSSFFSSLLHSCLQFFLSFLQQAEASLEHFSPFFLQHDLPSPKATPENINAAASNNVSFFIVCDLGSKNREICVKKT